MIEFLGALSINLEGNMWESDDLIENPINWDKPPKNRDGAWHVRIRMIDPDGEEFTKTFQSILTSRKLSEKRESKRELTWIISMTPKHLEAAFRRNTCLVKNLEGVNFLKGNRKTNLYTINLHEMASASPISLMARATSTKSWLWHQCLSHLSFDTINDLAKNDLVNVLLKLKYHKEHLCPSKDLEDLWKIVKARFSSSKPTNFTDDYLLVTLKNMFEKTDAQDVIWRSQQTEHGQALVKSWKLLTSCGVHIITFTTTMFVLLVEMKYPLSRFTLEQLVNVARLQVEKESEMSLELLRFTRQQLLEYQQE
nr:integrase, catalytic region, zinc finger, CCHC-type, peptidase aspartic, catalytic [Tanacetum cinerariifolium]